MAEFIDTKLSFGHSPSRSRARADQSCPPRQPNKRSLLVRPYRPAPALSLSLSRSSLAPAARFARPVNHRFRSPGGGKLRRKFREPVVHTARSSKCNARYAPVRPSIWRGRNGSRDSSISRAKEKFRFDAVRLSLTSLFNR